MKKRPPSRVPYGRASSRGALLLSVVLALFVTSAFHASPAFTQPADLAPANSSTVGPTEEKEDRKSSPTSAGAGSLGLGALPAMMFLRAELAMSQNPLPRLQRQEPEEAVLTMTLIPVLLCGSHKNGSHWLKSASNSRCQPFCSSLFCCEPFSF